MDNQVLRPSETTVEQNSLDAPMPGVGNGFVSQYSTNNGVYSTESLEVNDGTRPIVPRPEPQYAFTPKLNFSKRKALFVSVAITAVVGLLMGGTLTVLVRKQSKNENSALTSSQQDVNLKGANQSGVPSEIQGENESLLVNGDLITRSNIKISNNGFATTIKVQNLTADQTITLPGGTGTLCLDSNNCSYASINALAALQAQVSALGPIPTAGVDSLNGQGGAVTVQGSTNQISISTSNGVVTISTPQNLDANANVQFNSLAVSQTGQIVSNRLVQTAAGNDVSIDAGADSIVFTAFGQTYQFPSTGGANQTICTVETGCGASGSGDILQGGNSFGGAMIIGTNNAQALHLETNGVTRLIINSAGDAQFNANLDINGSLTVGNADQFVIDSTGVVTAGTWHGNAIGVGYGGTGLTATPTNGQLLIGNGSGYSLATLTNSDGTVDILNGAGSIELSVPRADQCSTCADFTLSNLADIIAINKSLLPAAAGAINLGGSSVPYSLLFLSGSSSNPASNNFTIGGTATTSRSINFPDADGIICLRETCIQLSPGAAQSGNINITGTVEAGSLILGGTATVDNLASAGGNALTLGATGAGQTTNLQGNSITFTNGSATYSFNSTTGTRTICDDSGNCAGTGGGVIATGGSAYNLPVFTSANTVINSIFSQNAGATAGTVNGTLQINGATLSGASALTVSSNGGANALNLSSGSGTLGLTGSTAIIQRVGNSLALDINSGANSTLTVTNSNGGMVANLSVEGGVNIGSGQSYRINNVDINTAGTLNNVAYLNQANAFSNVGNTTFAGTINAQTIGSSANFTGTLAVRGVNALTLGQASTNTGAIVFQNSSGSNTVTLRASNTNPGSSVIFTLPSATGSAGYCLSDTDGNGTLGFANCSSGLGISGSPTDNRLLKFTSSGTAVTNSSIDDDGSVVTIQGSNNSLAIVGGTVTGLGNSSISLGTASSTTGGINFYNEDTGNSVVLQSGATANNYSLILPTDQGTGCLRNDGSGQLTYFACISSGGGGGGGSDVTSNSATTGRLGRWTDGANFVLDDSSIRDNGARVGIGVDVDGTAVLTVGSAAAFKVTNAGALTVAGINNSTIAFDNGSTGITNTGSLAGVSTLTASGLLQSNANSQALSLTGAPTNSATQSLVRIGDAIASGNNAVNGGTYLGINAPASGAGSAADFINFQANGTSRLRVDAGGNITSGTINGVTIGGSGALSSGGFTLTLTGNSTLNQNLTTSSAVQFSSLALTNALTPANGGTGADTSGALAGAALIFNATTGQFEANNITSSDNSILIGNTDGNIDLTVSSCSTCASTDLSNLAATTNINSTLRAQTGVDLGAAANPFRDLYVYGSSASPASNNFRLTGTATGARTLTLPDTSGTLCLTNTCVMLQSSGHTPQSGYIDISNDLAVGGGFTLGGTATINTIAPAASTQLLLGATGSGQTSRLQGTSVSFVSGGITYNFSHNGSGTHTLCDDTGNCAGAGGGVTASGGAAFYLPVFSSANTVINSIISQDTGVGATIATVNGRLAVSAANTSGTTLAVSNSSFTANNSNLANFSFTNGNTTASATTVNGIAVSPTGSANGNANANTLNGIRLNNVTPIANNAFYGINVGTGYDDILRYNGTSVINGSGAVQNLNGQAASYYLNAGNINAGTLAVTRGGTGVGSFTANGVLYGNGTGNVQVTAAGSNGQCLIVVAGTPAWGSCAGVGSGVTLQSAYDNSSTAPTPAEIVLADNKNLRFTAADTSTDPSIIMKLNCTGCGTGTTGNFLVQNNSSATLFSVAGNGTIQIGTANNGISLGGTGGTTTGAFTLSGTARNTKSIVLTAEYAGAVLDATSDATCSATFNGTMTSGYSGNASPRQNYYNWAASSGQTNQCYDVIVQVPIPRDFSAWAPSNPWSMYVYNSAGTNSTSVYVYPIDTNNTLDTAYGGYTGVSSGTTFASANLTSPTGTYAAGGYMTLKIRMNSASDTTNVRIGNITLNYLSSF